jgi:hypothetical protein
VVLPSLLCPNSGLAAKQEHAMLAEGAALSDALLTIDTALGSYLVSEDSSTSSSSSSNFQRLLGPHGCLRSRLEVKAGLQKLQQELAAAGRPLVEG